MSRLEALSRALRDDKIELVLVQYSSGWDLSALHVNAGVLSTLLPTGLVVVNGQACPKAPRSGMLRRKARGI